VAKSSQGITTTNSVFTTLASCRSEPNSIR